MLGPSRALIPITTAPSVRDRLPWWSTQRAPFGKRARQHHARVLAERGRACDGACSSRSIFGELTADLASVFRAAMRESGRSTSGSLARLGQGSDSSPRHGRARAQPRPNAFQVHLEGGDEARSAPRGDHAVLEVRDTAPAEFPQRSDACSSGFTEEVRGPEEANPEGTGIGGSRLVQEIVRILHATTRSRARSAEATDVHRWRFHWRDKEVTRPRSPKPRPFKHCSERVRRGGDAVDSRRLAHRSVPVRTARSHPRAETNAICVTTCGGCSWPLGRRTLRRTAARR